MWAKRQAALINRVLAGWYTFDINKVARGMVFAKGIEGEEANKVINSIIKEVRK